MKRLLSWSLALLLAIGALAFGAIGSFADEITVTQWKNTGIETVNVPDQGFSDDPAYVIQLTDPDLWAAIGAASLETGNQTLTTDGWTFTVTLDGKNYDCTRISIFNQGSGGGFLRFVFPENGPTLKYNANYKISWSIAEEDGNRYVADQTVDVACKISTEKGEALSGADVEAIMEKNELNGEIEVYNLDPDSLAQIYNAEKEDISKLFDGMYSGDSATKFGTHNGTNVTVTWKYKSPATVTHYVLVTGGDTSKYSSRNPSEIVLRGSLDGATWTELDRVDYAGMGAQDSEPFGFEVDHPGAYPWYSIVMNTSGECQLNELLTYGQLGGETPTPPQPAQTTSANQGGQTPPQTTSANPPSDTPQTTEGGSPAPQTTNPATSGAPSTGDSGKTDGDGGPSTLSIILIVVAVVVIVGAVVAVLIVKKKKA